MIRFLAGLIVWVSLAVGAVSAVTAYLVPTTLPNDDLYRTFDEDGLPDGWLVTSAPAGPLVPRNGVEEPLFPAGTELSPEVRAEMIGDDPAGPVAARVKIKVFRLGLWTEKWVFAFATAALVLGGLLVRFSSRARAREEAATGGDTPAGALLTALETVRTLRVEAPQQDDMAEALRMLSDRLGELQQRELLVFGDAREALIGRLGLGRFAALMDRFADGERAINRAWSAAADARVGPPDQAADLFAEALESLERAEVSLAEAMDRLG